MNAFLRTLASHGIELRRAATDILQINVGKKCNQTCAHCHVNAGPARREMMTRETAERIIDWLAQTDLPTVDITGGAPELNPNFRYLVESCRTLERRVMDRCNLTVLFEPDQDDLPQFLARHEVEIVASLPCYAAQNVDEQRGDGVFEKSIRALQLLNEIGYGKQENLRLNLVYNPNGAFLPGPQAALEAAYKAELRANYGIEFHALYALANVPVERFAAWLRREGKEQEYQELLVNAFNPAAVAGLMCRNTLSIGWRGEVYDCDFNQMLNLQWSDAQSEAGDGPSKQLFLWDIEPSKLHQAERAILTGHHCFACTAGAGSSCGGGLL